MARLIDIDLRAELIWISFPYDQALVDVVRRIPGRRFHGGSKRWSAPLSQVERVCELLEPLHFKFTPRMREYCRRELGEESLRDVGGAKRAEEAELPPGTMRVSELNREVKLALDQRFPDDIWIVGELQSYDRNNRRHAYFELVERPGPEADPTAKVQAIMFSRTWDRVRRVMKRQAPGVELRDGLTVRFRAKVDLYSPQGKFQVVVEDVDPVFTSGKLRQNRDQVLRKLEEKGILEDNVELPWARCPLRVGLITSHGSDAYNDFLDELRRSKYPFRVTFHNASVQGVNTEVSMLRALRYFSKRADEFDVVAIVRGGGSRSDLAYFDTVAIGEAVCELPVKVVCGVGHHRDRCVLDFVATSRKTPTAAATAIVEKVSAADRGVADAARRVVDASRRRLDDALHRLERVSFDYSRAVDAAVRRERRRLNSAASRVVRLAASRLEGGQHGLDEMTRRLGRATTDAVRQARRALRDARRRVSVDRFTRGARDHRDEIDRLSGRLKASVERKIADARRDVEGLETNLRLVDPARVLERGFAIVHTEDGVARRAAEVSVGESARLQFADGEVTATIGEMSGDEEEE